MNEIFINFYNFFFPALSLLFFSYVLLVTKQKSKNCLYLLMGFALTIGCNYRIAGVSLGQVLMAYITIFGCMQPVTNRRFGLNIGTIKSNIILFTLYFSVTTVLGYISCSEYKVIGSVIQNDLRPAMQIFQLVALMGTVLYVLNIEKEESIKAINIFSRALLIIAVLGIVQWLVYLIFKIDIFPIQRGSIGVTAVTDHGFIRACSCVGEPKQFSKFMGIGISLEIFFNKHINDRINYKRIAIYGISILMTASATGILIAAAAVALYIYMKAKRKGLAILGILVVIVMFVIALRVPFVMNKIAYHTERGQIPGLEDCDTAVVRWLLNEPIYCIFGVGMGNTVAYANSYAPPGVEGIAKFLFTLRRGFVQYLGEGGIIGLVLSVSLFYSFIKRAKSNLLLKYQIIFLILMNLFLTLEAINGLQFLLIALVTNVAHEKYEDLTDKYSVPVWQHRKDCEWNLRSVQKERYRV